jgi:ABC-type spermidine/putrescine transport system permease subunit I
MLVDAIQGQSATRLPWGDVPASTLGTYRLLTTGHAGFAGDAAKEGFDLGAEAMFASIDAAEVVSILLWVLGFVCACWATRYLRSRKSRLLLLLVAVLFPVVGSLAVVVRLCVLVLRSRRPIPADGPQR